MTQVYGPVPTIHINLMLLKFQVLQSEPEEAT